MITHLRGYFNGSWKLRFSAAPPPWTKDRYSWDVAQVLNFLRGWGLTSSLSLRHLLQCSFAVVLIFSCRRISDLCLLGCKEPFCVVTPSTVSLCSFLLVSSRTTQITSLLRSSFNLHQILNFVRLFTSIGCWRSRLRHVAILQGAGVTAPPGSSRVAVASTALARGLSENLIMHSADWSSSHTLFSHYLHICHFLTVICGLFSLSNIKGQSSKSQYITAKVLPIHFKYSGTLN